MITPRHARSQHGPINVAWLKAAGLRALYTVLAAILPLGPGLAGGEVDLGFAGLLAALATVLSLATSAANLPELDGQGHRWWTSLLSRSLRTAGQVLVAHVGTEMILITEVDWEATGRAVLAGVLVTVIRFAMSQLPANPEVEVSKRE